jgi:hypothetical protein
VDVDDDFTAWREGSSPVRVGDIRSSTSGGQSSGRAAGRVASQPLIRSIDGIALLPMEGGRYRTPSPRHAVN